MSVVGSLLHISNCLRPDISYAVGVLARHAAAPGPSHVKACKRVVAYLYNTRCLGIVFKRDIQGEEANVPKLFEKGRHPLTNESDPMNNFRVFADSDFAGDLETRRSTSGVVILLNGGPIAWSSQLGKAVATSTCEAEINAATQACKDAVHLHGILCDIGVREHSRTVQIEEDNSAAKAQVEGGIRFIRNAKHYGLKLAFLQELTVDKVVSWNYCPSENQIADLLTKSLDQEKFERFVRQILSHVVT